MGLYPLFDAFRQRWQDARTNNVLRQVESSGDGSPRQGNAEMVVSVSRVGAREACTHECKRHSDHVPFSGVATTGRQSNLISALRILVNSTCS